MFIAILSLLCGDALKAAGPAHDIYGGTEASGGTTANADPNIPASGVGSFTLVGWQGPQDNQVANVKTLIDNEDANMHAWNALDRVWSVAAGDVNQAGNAFAVLPSPGDMVGTRPYWLATWMKRSARSECPSQQPAGSTYTYTGGGCAGTNGKKSCPAGTCDSTHKNFCYNACSHTYQAGKYLDAFTPQWKNYANPSRSAWDDGIDTRPGNVQGNMMTHGVGNPFNPNFMGPNRNMATYICNIECKRNGIYKLCEDVCASLGGSFADYVEAQGGVVQFQTCLGHRLAPLFGGPQFNAAMCEAGYGAMGGLVMTR